MQDTIKKRGGLHFVHFSLALHCRPAQHIGHCICRLALSLGGNVGVGVRGEASGIVAQHSADGLDIYPVLERQGGEGVAEVVEPNLGETSPL